MNQEERKQKIEEYGRGYEMLTEALAEIPREAWDFKPAPNEWSIHETLIHMPDSELNGLVRLYKMISEPGKTLMPYEEATWALEMDYQHQVIEDALEQFKLMRKRTYRLLKSLPDHVFDHTLLHPEPEWNPYTMDRWLDIYTDHVTGHIEQMKKNHEAWKEREN